MPTTSRFGARDLAQIAVFAALIAALTLPGAIPVGAFGVPITLQTLGVMLAGAILGARNGTLAVTLYVALGLAGLPVFAGGTAGLGVLVGPTGGFLVGFIPAAFVIGWLTERILPRYPLWAGLLVTALGGIVVDYAIGVPWMAIVLGIPLFPALLGMLPFLPGDLVKVIVTALVAKAVHRALPRLAGPDRASSRRATPAAEPTPAAETASASASDPR
ncbi:biotin transporter BioY [Rathayibacter sp. YIM 133350]|uniref:biotin transporter BioY n=1 Tax=Rathayibacter sp. YIM 133350 TaxID=3131992 RepID=UPI00307F96CA